MERPHSTVVTRPQTGTLPITVVNVEASVSAAATLQTNVVVATSAAAAANSFILSTAVAIMISASAAFESCTMVRQCAIPCGFGGFESQVNCFCHWSIFAILEVYTCAMT